MRELLHTADHILCTVLEKRFNAVTRAMQFSEDSCRIDFLTENDLRSFRDEIEKSVNDIIRRNLSVSSYSLSRSQAAEAGMDLRSVPADLQEVGIYEIAGFNRVACAGPHVKNTADIGLFVILKIGKSGKGCFSVKFTVR